MSEETQTEVEFGQLLNEPGKIVRRIHENELAQKTERGLFMI